MVRDADEFKLWIVQRLSEIECKGDPISIAIYTVAILGKSKDDPNIRNSCISYLQEFLGSNTERFIDDLLQVYSTAEFNSSTEDDPSPRIPSSIEAIDHSSRRSPENARKGRRSFHPPRRDRSSSMESGSSVEDRRPSRAHYSNSRDDYRDRQNKGSMPIQSIDSSRHSNHFYRRDRHNFRHGMRKNVVGPQIGIDPSVVTAMKKTFENNITAQSSSENFVNSQNSVPTLRDRSFVQRQRAPQHFPANSLLINNIPAHINTIGFLNEHYADFGKIENIQLNYGGKPDSALVSFATAEDAQNALQSSNSVFSDGSVNVSLLKNPSSGIKRRKTVVSFPPRSKLSLNNEARRKTDLVNSRLAEKNIEKGSDKLERLNELFVLKTSLLNRVESQLKSLNDIESSGVAIPDTDRAEIEQMKDTFLRQKDSLSQELLTIDNKRKELQKIPNPSQDLTPEKLRVLLLSVELSLLNPKCPSRVHLVRKRQQILGKMGTPDNSFERTVPRLVTRVIHTSTNERFEVDKRCRILTIRLNISIDLNQLCDIFRERLFAESVDAVDEEYINATYSSHSKADRVLSIINSFTTQPLVADWADQMAKCDANADGDN